MKNVDIPSKFVKTIQVIHIILVNSYRIINTILDAFVKSMENDSINLDNLFNTISYEEGNIEALHEFNKHVKYETKIIDCRYLKSQSNEWRVVATYAY